MLDAGDVPGYCIVASPGSRRRQNFIVGNGSKVPNQGQVHLNLDATVADHKNALQSIFQVAEITRPLMSVSRICDQGLKAMFDHERAVITNKSGNVVAEFLRQGGLYVATMTLKRPNAPEPASDQKNTQPFGRPGQ